MTRRYYGLTLAALTVFLLASCGDARSQGTKLEPLNVAIAAVQPTRIPLWAAQEAGLFASYGLDVRIIAVGGSATATQALLSNNVDIANAATATLVSAAAKGAPIAIVGNLSFTPFKMMTVPSIRSVQQLKGKKIGISRPGGLDTLTTRRLLRKLGFDPDKDVILYPVGITGSGPRIGQMMAGQIDAGLATDESRVEYELKGYKVNVVADVLDYGIFVTGDFATTRDFLKKHPQKIMALLKAVSESFRLLKRDKELGYRVIRKHLKQDEPVLVQAIYEAYAGRSAPDRPYPVVESIKQTIEDLRLTTPDLKIAPRDVIDSSVVEALEKEGFFAKTER
jgi:NitT/TauT family transport system substrate-binding protein